MDPSKAYKVYRAEHPFAAREGNELSMSAGDLIHVWRTESGAWPDMSSWVTGRNDNTKEQGQFPGNFTSFLKEVTPTPVLPPKPGAKPPPIVPRPSHNNLTSLDSAVQPPPPTAPRPAKPRGGSTNS